MIGVYVGAAVLAFAAAGLACLADRCLGENVGRSGWERRRIRQARRDRAEHHSLRLLLWLPVLAVASVALVGLVVA